MARAFIVERKTRSRMTDLDGTAFMRDPVERGRRIEHRRRTGAVSRKERIAEEGVLDVRQHQFLMLLLVMKPEHRQCASLRARMGEKLFHRLIDMRAIGSDFGCAGPRQQSAIGAREGCTEREIVGIEDRRHNARRTAHSPARATAPCARKTRSCARDAISWGSHRASTAPIDPRPSKAPRWLRSTREQHDSPAGVAAGTKPLRAWTA